jgi:large subunit ribosomal protein L29
MKTAEIRKLKTEEIAGSIMTLREEIAEMRRRLRMGETTNVRSIRAKRKDLARLLTIMSENLAKETK